MTHKMVCVLFVVGIHIYPLKYHIGDDEVLKKFDAWFCEVIKGYYTWLHVCMMLLQELSSLYPTKLQVFNCNLAQLDGLTVTTQQNMSSDLILKDVSKKDWANKGRWCDKITSLLLKVQNKGFLVHPCVIIGFFNSIQPWLQFNNGMYVGDWLV